MTETITPVPNKPKTPISNFRIPLELKQAAQAKAKENGTDLTAVVVKALERYVKTK
jgi:predicted HicB family RNase H-like nuclease